MSRTRPAAADRDRGVSEAVGYVLLFSILIVGVGLVSASGLTFLSESTEREQVENGERALVSAAATLDDIHRQSDTRRSFALPLAGGTVTLNESAINVSSPDAPAFNRTYTVNSLEQRFDRSPEDVTVAYEGGAVFRSSGAGARYRPAIACGEDRAVVSLVRLDGGNFRVSEGETDVAALNPRSLPTEAPVLDFGRSLAFSAEVTGVRRNYTTFGSPGTLGVNVSASANPTGWDQYFRRSDSAWVDTGGSIYACENVDSALVRVTTIRLIL